MEKRYVRFAGFIIRAVAEHLNHYVSGGKHIPAFRDDLSAFGEVFCVRISGLSAGARLDNDFQSSLGERWNRTWDHSHAPFPGEGFPGDSHNHAVPPLLRGEFEPANVSTLAGRHVQLFILQYLLGIFYTLAKVICRKRPYLFAGTRGAVAGISLCITRPAWVANKSARRFSEFAQERRAA
jgi:hypothetical protein